MRLLRPRESIPGAGSLVSLLSAGPTLPFLHLYAAGPRRTAPPIPFKEVDEMPHRDDLKDELIQTDEQFRRLYEEHKAYERRLEEINQKSLLSQDDEIEEKKIKLHKLVLKDRMEEILRAHREARVSA
jgi:uncharacterized protein YdcH (DUF465 family)